MTIKCPVCDRAIQVYAHIPEVSCCGVTCDDKETWNRYFAAMRLTIQMTSTPLCISAGIETSQAFEHAMGVFNA